MPRFAVILPAAGRSTRFGGPQKKPFLALDGRPVWLRTAELFVKRPDVVQCLVAVGPEDRAEFVERHGPTLMLLDIQAVAGGGERFESVANCLAQLRADVEFVAVHDAVRPMASAQLIDAVFARAAACGAALAAVPVADTLKRVGGDNRVAETVPRAGLWQAQTPQAFRRDWLAAAYAGRAALGDAITDDARLVEAAGHPVEVVPGEATNFKITTPADLALAETLTKARTASAEAERPRRAFDDDDVWR